MLSDPLTQIPLFAALLFVILGSPAVYKLVDGLVSKLTGGALPIVDPSTGAPTKAGLLVHGAVYFLLAHLYLKSYSTGFTSLTSF